MIHNLVSYLREKPILALVGATNNTSKYGNIIMKNMMKKGFRIIPINPRADSVEDVPAYPDLKSAVQDHSIGLVVYVIPPKYTLESLHEAYNLGLHRVWVQPGAGDTHVRTFLNQNHFDFLMDACVMVET